MQLLGGLGLPIFFVAALINMPTPSTFPSAGGVAFEDAAMYFVLSLLGAFASLVTFIVGRVGAWWYHG